MIQILKFENNKKMTNDVLFIFQNLRENDREGLVENMDESIKRHIDKASELYIAYADDCPIALFGLTDRYPLNGYKCQAFFLGTEAINYHKKSFVQIGRVIIHGWQQKYGKFYCFVWNYYKESYQMIRAFGFKFKAILGDVDMFVKE